MRSRILVWAVMAMMTLASPPVAGASTGPKPDDLPAAFSLAWAHHDAVELGNLVMPDVDFVNVGAIWLHGKSFETYHARVFAGRFRMSTITPLAVDVRYMRPDIAIVRWSWRIDGERLANDTPSPARYGLMTLIAERRGAKWLISNAQNTNSGPVRPEAEGLVAPIYAPRAPAN